MRMQSIIAMVLMLVSVAFIEARGVADETASVKAPEIDGPPATFAEVKEFAESFAAHPYRSMEPVAEPFRELNYDEYRLIAARPENALWRGEGRPFWAEFFAAGFLYPEPVHIYKVAANGEAKELEYGERWFQFRGEVSSLRDEEQGGFAGLRLLSKQPGDENMSEFLVFLGSSYFRGIGADQVYGASCRALAIDIGLAKPEEFPRFTYFWLVEPEKHADQMRVWAIIDSCGVVGAYEFVISRGEETTVDVDAQLYVRHGIQKLAIAPITSMWMWGEPPADGSDPRPEVHDSDTLLIHHGANEWVWRELERPEQPRVESWPVKDLRGFGLLQYDRNRSHYADAEAKYERRPSVWITPRSSWGPGRVELLELPAEHEGHDNIGAYWVSDRPVEAGVGPRLQYRITFGDHLLTPRQMAQVAENR